jgi:hypothetical protein
MVGKRAAIIEDDVARLRFVRRSVAKHAVAAARRADQEAMAARQSTRRKLARLLRASVILLVTVLVFLPEMPRSLRATTGARLLTVPTTARPALAAPAVWLVEEKAPLEIYSNGLHVDHTFLTSTRRRAYRTFDRATWRAQATRQTPAGIVFHTTESQVAPFDSRENARLKRNGLELLAFAARNHLYHFLIDRFGRVFRVVAETDYANHAGNSVWADPDRIYWSLNQGFIGVAFEAQTDAGATDAADTATPAQINAARLLTELLRSKYGIAAANCVTHAQVSINLQSMRLGYHTDWAANFPFREIGLGDGYDMPVAALSLFGFDYDSVFLRANGGRVWKGLVLSDEQLLRQAAANGTTFDGYRHTLQRKYREWKRREAALSTDDASGDRK